MKSFVLCTLALIILFELGKSPKKSRLNSYSKNDNEDINDEIVPIKIQTKVCKRFEQVVV